MRLTLSGCKPSAHELPIWMRESEGMMEHNNHLLLPRKEKVVVIMGATGTGKSRLSIDLAMQFPSEIINADKMQVYKGLDIVTNKITMQERRGVPHHLLGVIDPDDEFMASDFRALASTAITMITNRRHVPVVVGGSNSFIEALVADDQSPLRFPQLRYDCCFLWVDAVRPVLDKFVSDRVDHMLEAGLVNEVRQYHDPYNSDYSYGIRKAIGLPELDRYVRAEERSNHPDKQVLARILAEAVDEIKDNTCKLACRQVQKIYRLSEIYGWKLHRLEATEALRQDHGGDQEAFEVAWQTHVVRPASNIVRKFLLKRNNISTSAPVPAGVVAAEAAAAAVGGGV